MNSPSKRKRAPEAPSSGQSESTSVKVSASESDSDSDAFGPQLPGKAKSSPTATEKRRRVMGPAAPPPPRTSSDSSSDSDSSDDDFGPKPPTEAEIYALQEAARAEALRKAAGGCQDGNGADGDEARSKPQRAEWMTMVPTTGDLALSSRIDPTKLRPGKFSTNRRGGGGGKPKTGEIDSIWTETIKEKQERLQNEVLGIAEPRVGPSASAASASASAAAAAKAKEDRAIAQRVAAQIEKERGKSLLKQREDADRSGRDSSGKGKGSKGAEEEDDPSSRGFNYAKDMASTARISTSQRNEMLTKMGQFNTKFSGGNFL